MMERWLAPALAYIPAWLEYQMRLTRQPGCVIAIAHKGQIVLEQAFGHANAVKGVALTPQHRFRVASHSKSFTAAAIMKLCEAGRLRLDDHAGKYVKGLHRMVARATIAQLLSHSAGIIRDGTDSGQWQERRPFLNEAELRAALAEPPTIDANTRFKYSNHGFGLAGLVIEAITGESYTRWVKREIVDAAGLAATDPDLPAARGATLAHGHTGEALLGKRLAIPGRMSTNALASATGFVSTAADLARFYTQIDPDSRHSFLSVESRREMIRRQWRDPHGVLERYYGLGIMSGQTGGWDWAGHAGGFPGFITRTSMLPGRDLTVSVLTNAVDGAANLWFDGVVHILATFARHGAPTRRTRDWTGRWWSLWGAFDLVAMGDKVLIANPALLNPFTDASEFAITARDRGQITLANGYANHGEPVRRTRDARGRVTAFWLSGGKLLRAAPLAAELQRRYG
jgi:CubicO group peptidase (beta-lactamase class C family)